MINVNDEHILSKINYKEYSEKVLKISEMIENGTGAGSDYLGWLNYPASYDQNEFNEILKCAQKIRKSCEFLVVCGIGGSYLGSRAVIDSINGLNSKDKLKILFLGQTLSTDYIYDVLETIKGKKFAINVISKSGTTTETAISFRLVKDLLESQIGKEASKELIFITTDAKNGLLRKLADEQHYPVFTLPSNIGGRYSVFTAVGLLPLACANIDIKAFMDGAKKSMEDLKTPSLLANPAYKYAVIRDYLYRQGKSVELFVNCEPRLVQLSEWLKQLFGESEGKDGKGLFPASATFSTDLHSLGQFIQDGSKILFETVLRIQNPNHEIVINENADNFDELNYLKGKSLKFVNEKMADGTLEAHTQTGNVPNVIIEIESLNEFSLGYLLYFYMKTCAMSAYLLEVNPFNQPGVEVYKKNMFRLLGKK